MSDRAPAPAVLAVVAHPDDVEFIAAGTLLLLREAGWAVHYLNLSGGDLGSMTTDRDETRRIRTAEGRAAAAILGATFHQSVAHDLCIFYEERLLRRLAAVIRRVRPRIVLTHSPEDYMEDHMNTARLAVSAAFARGIPHFVTEPPEPAYAGDVTLYHGMPHGLRDGMRRTVAPDVIVDTTAVHEVKRRARRCMSARRPGSTRRRAWEATSTPATRCRDLSPGWRVATAMARAGGGTFISGFLPATMTP